MSQSLFCFVTDPSIVGTQEQRYGYFKASGRKSVAFEQSLTTPDVPYGSYFRVSLLCLFSEAGKGKGKAVKTASTSLRVAVTVQFLKSTMWSGKIRSSVTKQTKEVWALWKGVLEASTGRHAAHVTADTTSRMLPCVPIVVSPSYDRSFFLLLPVWVLVCHLKA